MPVIFSRRGLAVCLPLAIALPPPAPSQTTASAVLNTTTAAKLTLDPTSAAAMDPFDKKVREAMVGSADPISVMLASNTTTVPKAVADWRVKVQQSKGEVRLKSTNLGLGKVVGAVVSGAVCKAVPGVVCDIVIVTAESLQKSSKKYNAIVLVAKQKDVECVVGVTFYLRKGDPWKAVATTGDAAPALPLKGFGTPPAAITPCPFSAK